MKAIPHHEKDLLPSDGPSTMTAIAQHVYGPDPEAVLCPEEVATPTMGADEMLVRVHAASVDRGTWHILAGLPYPIRLAGFGLREPKHLNPGRAFSGTVEAVGADAAGVEVGDEVFGECDGAFAPHVRAKTAKLSVKPGNASFEEAATMPISGVTALQAVRDQAQVKAGDKVLVIGASGGVGSFAVQIAKAFGAEVTGVCSTAKVDFVRSLGADDVIDYSRTELAGAALRFDAVLDIGGNGRLSDLRRLLTPRGTLVIVGGETSGRLLGGSGRQVRAMLLSPFVSQKLGTFISSTNEADLSALRELVVSGQVRPVIDRTYSLAEAAAAVRYVIDGRASGKVVIRL